jgi:hypothetical protein
MVSEFYGKIGAPAFYPDRGIPVKEYRAGSRQGVRPSLVENKLPQGIHPVHGLGFLFPRTTGQVTSILTLQPGLVSCLV